MSITSKFKSTFHCPLRANLIFNAGSGRPEESSQQLSSILSEMQDQQILPEVYTVRRDSKIETVVHNALKTVGNRLASGTAAQVLDLKERPARLWAATKEIGELPPRLVTSSMERLTQRLEKAEPILQAAWPAESSDLFHAPSLSAAKTGHLYPQNPESTGDDRIENG